MSLRSSPTPPSPDQWQELNDQVDIALSFGTRETDAKIDLDAKDEEFGFDGRYIAMTHIVDDEEVTLEETLRVGIKAKGNIGYLASMKSEVDFTKSDEAEWISSYVLGNPFGLLDLIRDGVDARRTPINPGWFLEPLISGGLTWVEDTDRINKIGAQHGGRPSDHTYEGRAASISSGLKLVDGARELIVDGYDYLKTEHNVVYSSFMDYFTAKRSLGQQKGGDPHKDRITLEYYGEDIEFTVEHARGHEDATGGVNRIVLVEHTTPQVNPRYTFGNYFGHARRAPSSEFVQLEKVTSENQKGLQLTAPNGYNVEAVTDKLHELNALLSLRADRTLD